MCCSLVLDPARTVLVRPPGSFREVAKLLTSLGLPVPTAEDVNTAVEAAAQAFVSWSKLTGYQRAKHLYSVARHVQKHARLVAVVEALDNGKTIRETRDADTAVVVRHLYHYAGWAQLMSEEMSAWASRKRSPEAPKPQTEI